MKAPTGVVSKTKAGTDQEFVVEYIDGADGFTFQPMAGLFKCCCIAESVNFAFLLSLLYTHLPVAV